ncbi:MAG: hypothetical protein Ct9H90mP22_4630 [Gammaproteobacteria bacterium]|nr:MAG: hypothetical protein Ct9H90mP22_4630 [Gammaproteobacteria bacterium]
MSNPESRELFLKRNKIKQSLRKKILGDEGVFRS